MKYTPILLNTGIEPKHGDLVISPRYHKILMIFGRFENSYTEECIAQKIIVVDENNYIVASTENSIAGKHNIDEVEIMKLVDYYNEHGVMPNIELESNKIQTGGRVRFE